MIIFSDKKEEKRTVATIIQAVMPGWWIVKDDQGRKHRVASAKHYRRGETVVIISGQIVDSKPMVETKTKKVQV